MAAAAAPGPKAPPGESGGPAASALSMERIQSLTELVDLEAAYSRLCEEEVCGAGHGRRRGPEERMARCHCAARCWMLGRDV